MAKLIDILDSINQKFDPGASGMSSTNAQDGIIEAYNSGGGSSTFIGLTDTPNDYAAQSGKYVTVGIDQLVFTDPPTGAGEANRGENLAGGGAEVYAGMNGFNLTFREFVGGSTKLQITQDINNISFDVIEANIVHQNLSGAGTNTHVQIDAHIADTSNPHNTSYTDLLDVPASFPPSPHTHVESDITDLDRARWRGEFVGGTTYEKNDMSRESTWTAIANKQTTDNIEPQPTGNEGWVSDFAANVTPPLTLAPQADINTAVLLSGQFWDLPVFAEVNEYRYRVPNISGSFTYELWQITNLGTAYETIQQIVGPHIPGTTDWITVEVNERRFAPGTTVSLVVVIRPTTQPNTLSGNWDVKNTNGVPATGQAIFQNNEYELWVHNTDNNSVDRSAGLQSVIVGGALTFGGSTWTITKISIRADHVRYSLTPTQSRPLENVYALSFSWSDAANLPVEYDPGYFTANNNITGLSGPDLNNLVTNQHGYGVDLYTDEVVVSPDWDIVAVSAATIEEGVTGPVSSVDDNLALFDGTTGQRIKDAGVSIARTINLDTDLQFILAGQRVPVNEFDFLLVELNGTGEKRAAFVKDLPFTEEAPDGNYGYLRRNGVLTEDKGWFRGARVFEQVADPALDDAAVGDTWIEP